MLQESNSDNLRLHHQESRVASGFKIRIDDQQE